jgi:hypothetical protein
MNTLYPIAREAFLSGQLDWTTADIRFALLDGTATYSPSDVDMTNLQPSVLFVMPVEGRGATGGVASADVLRIVGQTAISPLESAVLFDATTDMVIAWMDESPDFPFLLDGTTDYVINPGGQGAFFAL